mmetsp:Transcript_10937/g.20437  ORF Transcript_10937/g.20437 Transcript_10937/m.20437 type:complete len:307 (-) Transcript_10937:204-1124(-)
MTTTTNRRRRICLFGTSANPPTGKGGHVGIVQYLASVLLPVPMIEETNDICLCSSSSRQQEEQHSSCPRFHEIRVLPVYKHMFDEKREHQASYDDRLAMCQLAFQDIPNVVVSDDERRCFDWVAQKQGLTTMEEKMKLRVGTVDLLDMLLKQDDSLEITLALGADTFMDLTRWKWKRSKDIIRMIKGRMIVFQRIFHGDEVEKVKGSNILHNTSSTANVSKVRNNAALISDDEILERINDVANLLKDTCPNLKDHVMVVKLPNLSSVSSSKLRRCNSKEDLSLLREELDQRVLEYIKTNKLYGFST